MRKFVILIPILILAGCYSENVAPLIPTEPYIAEVDLSELKYAWDLEYVELYSGYANTENKTIQDFIDDKKYMALVYGEKDTVENEADWAAYLQDKLEKFDSHLGIVYTGEGAPMLEIEKVYKKLMNTHDQVSATLYTYSYSIEKINEGYFIDIWNYFSTNKIEMVTINKKMDEMVESLQLEGLSDYEKVEILYQFVIDRMEYVSNDIDTEHSPMGFIMHGEGVCQAYAVSLQMLMERAGLESRYIIGEIYEDQVLKGETTGHAWNMVKLDGAWYHLDSTWDDDADYWSYFLVSDGIMEISRSWEKEYYEEAPSSY